MANESRGDKCQSKVGRQMPIESSVSTDFLSTFVDSMNVFDCHISGVVTIQFLCLLVATVIYAYYMQSTRIDNGFVVSMCFIPAVTSRQLKYSYLHS